MINFKFADIGEGIHEGVILKWNYEVGDTVEEGETMVVVETDKVNAEIPAPDNGVLKKKGAEEGEEIHVGDVLAVIDDGSGEDDAEGSSQDDDAKEASQDDAESKPQQDDEEEEEEAASVVGSVETSNEVLPASDEHSSVTRKEASDRPALATPVARKMAKDLGVDIKTIKGSGPEGRVMKEDIRAAAEGTKEKAAEKQAPKQEGAPAQGFARPPMPALPQEGVRREKVSKLRQSIVKAMYTSNQLIPATTIMDEIDVSKLVAFRNENKGLAKEHDAKLTYLPLIIKAVIKTIKQYPVFNASYDHETQEIVYKDFFNVGVAVDTPDGLIVPNIKNADQKSIFELASEVDRLASAARERSIKLDELKNTTFSVTNYGAFGATLGTPVINHPETGILGVGAITKKPVVNENDEIVVGHVLPISLTIDHRIIDGGDGGRFMLQLKQYLNDPMLLLLS